MVHKKVKKRSPLNQMLSVGILVSFLMISRIADRIAKDNADNKK
tara:strand:+ start:516 stop:647 length:132 start_codon:yes stop_codon:yes gene_type:complete